MKSTCCGRWLPDCETTHTDPKGLMRMPAGRHDLGLASGLFTDTDPTLALALLARLRDLHAQIVFVLLHADEQPRAAAALQAMGLNLVVDGKAGEEALWLYGIDIASYKPAPDWLNPDHWANPERWNKERW